MAGGWLLLIGGALLYLIAFTPGLNGKEDLAFGRSEESTTFTAQIEWCLPLKYAPGTAVLSGASSLLWINNKLGIIRDNEPSVGIFSPVPPSVLPLILGDPPGPAQSKNQKADTEAAASTTTNGRQHLFLFGSGSGNFTTRTNVTVYQDSSSGWIKTTTFNARSLYQMLSSDSRFSGSELNIEGAFIFQKGTTKYLRLFNRGNGAILGAQAPVDSSCDILFSSFYSYVLLNGPTPKLHNIIVYSLGTQDSVPYSFTDAAPTPRGFFYVAAAENSINTVEDGATLGVGIGYFGFSNPLEGQWAPLKWKNGTKCLDKAEGIALYEVNQTMWKGFIVTDLDDDTSPSNICLVHIHGDFPR